MTEQVSKSNENLHCISYDNQEGIKGRKGLLADREKSKDQEKNTLFDASSSPEISDR